MVSPVSPVPPESQDDLDQTQVWTATNLDQTQIVHDVELHAVKASAPTAVPQKVLVNTLGDFRLNAKLGQGNMGTVYKAVQVSKNRWVALKVISKEVAQRPGFVERFHREVRTMGKLNHPKIVKCYAAGEAHGFIYVAMELLEGGTVGDALAKLGHFSVADSLLILKEAAEGLQYAHDHHIIHRDVKPDNFLMSAAGEVKLADLGLAKATDDSDVSLTSTGSGMGTPIYAAPEQIRDAKHIDHRSDLYALGIVFYQCLTGKLPFEGTNLLQLIQAKEKGTYRLASAVKKSIPSSLDKILSKLLAKVPDQRYASCLELLQDIEWSGLVGSELSFLDRLKSPE